MATSPKRIDPRTIFLYGDVDTASALACTEQMFAFDQENKKAPIHLYINSAGGDLYDMFAIHDVMKIVSAPVYTYAVGTVASAASLILAAGEKRFMSQNSWLMLHEPIFDSPELKAGDFKRDYEQNERICRQMVGLYAKYTGQEAKKIQKDIEGRDFYLNAEQAKEYGIIDQIISFKASKT